LGSLQLWIPRAEKSGLLTHIAATESISLCADEKLTAFMEIKLAVEPVSAFSFL
jgi:hypothetical protein